MLVGEAVVATAPAFAAFAAYEAVPKKYEPVIGALKVMLCELNKAKSLLFASSVPLPIIKILVVLL